jgi:hypothetical protein
VRSLIFWRLGGCDIAWQRTDGAGDIAFWNLVFDHLVREQTGSLSTSRYFQAPFEAISSDH